ncbi:MAG: universal stress protein [Sandaracinaceae bacterium]|jgi:nucleotide-binding universal stress UspA family protein|nr:universal stress protein [Sandaracinaceae bacterium]
MNIRTVVVGLDSSPRATTVLAAARELATKYGARLAIVRAVGMPVDFPETIIPMSSAQLADKLLLSSQDTLKAQIAAIPPEMLLKGEARFGTPWQVICDMATELKADLVVVGTHNRNAIDWFLGTTASRVTNHAPCTVMVIRAQG